MASFFKLAGAWTAAPAVGAPSSDPDMPAPIDERLSLVRKHYDEVRLTSDGDTVVGFGGVVNAHVVIIKPVTKKVTVKLTSADGTDQVVPVEEFLAVISENTPFTAIDLARETGVITNVKVFLGEKA
jgi:hypothetical protein